MLGAIIDQMLFRMSIPKSKEGDVELKWNEIVA